MPKLLTRKNSRLKNHNYSDNGWYFVTICSKDRKNIFGEINNKYVGEGLAPSRDNAPVRNKNNVKLSKIGKIIDKTWNEIPNQYDNIELDERIIMPNHIHGILIVNYREGASPSPAL